MTASQKQTGFYLVSTAIISILFLLLANKILGLSLGLLTPFVVYGIIVLIIHLLVFISAFYLYKDPALQGKPLSKNKSLPLISCMVAVHNEEHYIVKCLDSIRRQSYQEIEIIVIDDASTDNTLSVLQQYAITYSAIKIISLKKNVGKKRALCHGMLAAKGNIFIHTDSDSIWGKNAVKHIARVMINDSSVGAVSGHGRASNAGKNFLTKMQDAWMEGQFSIRKSFESNYGAVTCVSGPLAAYRKEAVFNFLPAWMNDEFLGSEFRFATDRTLTALVLSAPWRHQKLTSKYRNSIFCSTIYPQQKWKVLYTKSAKSKTIVPSTLRGFMRQQVRWKKSFIRNMFFNTPFFWRKHFLVATVYYLHIVFVLVAPIIVFRVFFTPHPHYIFSVTYYTVSVLLIGLLFGLSIRLEDPSCKYWYYRPIMNLFSASILSLLIIYSALTIKKMLWYRS